MPTSEFDEGLRFQTGEGEGALGARASSCISYFGTGHVSNVLQIYLCPPLKFTQLRPLANGFEPHEFALFWYFWYFKGRILTYSPFKNRRKKDAQKYLLDRLSLYGFRPIEIEHQAIIIKVYQKKTNKVFNCKSNVTNVSGAKEKRQPLYVTRVGIMEWLYESFTDVFSKFSSNIAITSVSFHC